MKLFDKYHAPEVTRATDLNKYNSSIHKKKNLRYLGKGLYYGDNELGPILYWTDDPRNGIDLDLERLADVYCIHKCKTPFRAVLEPVSVEKNEEFLAKFGDQVTDNIPQCLESLNAVLKSGLVWTIHSQMKSSKYGMRFVDKLCRDLPIRTYFIPSVVATSRVFYTREPSVIAYTLLTNRLDTSIEPHHKVAFREYLQEVAKGCFPDVQKIVAYSSPPF